MPDTTFFASRILIVDDEPANVLLLERMLNRAGYANLISTQDSREVLALAREVGPDLILLDLLMPNMDGYQVMAQLRAELADEAYLPILVLTADVTPQALQRALSSGARDFLTKPFDQTELLLRVRNLLETRHLYLGLQGQLERLEQVNLETRRAVSAMAHDINQPLAAVRLMTEVLQQESAAANRSEVIAEDLRSIYAASEQMSEMINEVSDLTRLQIGRPLVLSRTPLDIVALIRAQAGTIGRAAKRKIPVQADVKALEGQWDRQRLTRVISNLLSNAVKFSPMGGSITVEVHASEDGVVFSVADNGVGVPEADLPHVFEPYFRASNAHGKIEGTGIGLASVRQIVEQHGGSIVMESQLGQGTTVTVKLPLA